MNPTSRAAEIVAEWERLEGESMRDGHRQTLERLISAALYSLQAEAEEVPSLELTIESYQRQLDSLRKQLADAQAEIRHRDDELRTISPTEYAAYKQSERALQSLKDRVRKLYGSFMHQQALADEGTTTRYAMVSPRSVAAELKAEFPDILATQTEEER